MTRIAIWSGPRSLSTALMRSFGARGDCACSDEPFYAAYLAATGLAHPHRDDTLAAGERDPFRVAEALEGPIPGAAPIWFQKHMAHHMLAETPLDWMGSARSAFLIRAPERVLASAVRSYPEAGAADIGVGALRRIFEAERARIGAPPPVIAAEDLRADPDRTLRALCAALEIPFTTKMLSWAPGPRAEDGAWAPAWYASVEASTGFAGAEGPLPELEPRLAAIVDDVREDYEVMRAVAL